MDIGDNILKIRKEKGFKRSGLVEKMHSIYGDNAVDYRTVERIERGDINKGRLSTLLQIANALGIGIDKLYAGTQHEDRATREEAMQDLYITKPDTRGDVFRYSDKSSLEIISPRKSPYICFLLRLDPGGKTRLEQDPEGTSKFVFVTRGELNISIGGLGRKLLKGYFAQFNSQRPHYFENISDRPASALVYQNPKRY